MVCSKKMIIFFKLEFKENQITSQKLSPFLKLPWISLIPVRNLVHSFMKLDKMILKFTWKYISKTTQEYVLYSHSYFLLTVSLPPPCYKHVFEEGWGGKQAHYFGGFFPSYLNLGNAWSARGIIITLFLHVLFTLSLIFNWSNIKKVVEKSLMTFHSLILF